MSYQEYRPNSFNVLPLVVKNLLIINGLFFLATVLFENQGIDLRDMLGLHFPTSEKFTPYQIITYMFMHGDFMHLFFNMFALWMFGNTLENLWGPKRFLIYYLISGIGAAFCHYCVVYYQMAPLLDAVNSYLANPSLSSFTTIIDINTIPYLKEAMISGNTNEALNISVDYMQTFKADFLNAPVVVGASGSVFGILLAFGMLFPNTMLYIYFAIPIKAKWFVVLYGAMELFSGIANRPADNVAHFAHLGGMLFGFILIKYWQKKSNRFY